MAIDSEATQPSADVEHNITDIDIWTGDFFKKLLAGYYFEVNEKTLTSKVHPIKENDIDQIIDVLYQFAVIRTLWGFTELRVCDSIAGPLGLEVWHGSSD